MKLYNTLTRTNETFEPNDGKTVGMYVCGPTVYDHIHIGNVRPIIVFDTLRRYFERFKGWNVIHVQNVTDVDDKLIARSQETGETVDAIAETYRTAYFDLLANLNVLAPTHSPLATEHIAGMIDLVKDLVEKGYAYERDGDVYFRVAALEGYGKLSGRRLEDQEAGSRVEALETKENPLDFTLWKAAKPGEPKWPSPWGEGRPGWHTECVVLSHEYLGDRLDIHAGGNDLVFPHHENEIAQAEAVYGPGSFFRFWLHNGMLSFGGEKMSKSLGNFEYAYKVLERFDAETVRYFYLSRHYRKPLAYAEEGLAEAAAARTRVSTLLADVEAELRSGSGEPGEAGQAFIASLAPFRERYVAAMDDDLNTVGAIGVIQELVAEANRFRREAEGTDRLALQTAVDLIRELGYPLGLFQPQKRPSTDDVEDRLIGLLLELRKALREKKEFQLADMVRDRLADLGYILKDGPEGTIWTRSA